MLFMLSNLLLLSITIGSLFLCVKYKSELEKLKEKPFPDDRRKPISDEFTIGLSKLTSEFTGPITRDSLTGLPGREAFEDRLQQTINQSKRFEKSFALIFMNINGFAQINDEKGYETGDKLLKEVAQRMQTIIRQIDTVTRYAGNTFLFLLPQLSLPETAAYVAQRILDNMVLPFKIDNQELFINANVGVAIYPIDGQESGILLKNANAALLQSKEQGRGRYQFYHQELHALGQRELALHTYLCNPDLFNKMSIQYQPCVNVVTDEVVCVQATPFIKLTDFGIVTFLEFAKIAQNCKKIIEIGEWTLQTSAAQFQKWHQEGFKPAHCVVCVTLSQIENPQFIYNATKIIQEYQIQPNQIVFEIIDANALNPSDFSEKYFSLLTHHGFGIALSVLTLGHFALQKMTHLPLHYLKMDAKLIQDDEARQKNEIIIHTLITLAKDLQINTIAMGVNNIKQKEFFQALGCEFMQGELFAVSVPDLI